MKTQSICHSVYVASCALLAIAAPLTAQEPSGLEVTPATAPAALAQPDGIRSRVIVDDESSLEVVPQALPQALPLPVAAPPSSTSSSTVGAQEPLFPNPNIEIRDSAPAANIPNRIAPVTGQVDLPIEVDSGEFGEAVQIIQPPIVQPPPQNAPLFSPRAVAPPLGDISVSNLSPNPADFVRLGTTQRIERLLLKDTPAEEVLWILARTASLNLTFVGEASGSEDGGAPLITMTIEDQPVESVFNQVLRLANLQAVLQGDTILVGPQLETASRDNTFVRTLRINQASAEEVVAFLNNTKTQAPELLDGLRLVQDQRLNAVTLIGNPQVIELASSLVQQLDLRQRQATINVKILDISLSDNRSLDTSFSFGANNTFVQSSSGSAFIDFRNGPTSQKLLATITASVASGTAKVLSDPTLTVLEGQRAVVELTEDVFAGFLETVIVDNGAVLTTQEILLQPISLTLELEVKRIDDNGFITMTVLPEVSSIAGTFTSGGQTATLVGRRKLTSGDVRLRDGQTLILAGIIQENDTVNTTKVPILGDIPIIEALFRSTSDNKSRSEVVVLVTPQIVRDNDQSDFGWNYTPSREVQEMLDPPPRR
ncbi:MAG: secretin N-terminal domain-containing protein [Cyanobacteria bacterium P01_H01_bin.121]